MKLQFIKIFFLLIILFSCNKENDNYPYPCKNGNCYTQYKIVYMGDTISQDSNGYWEIEYNGLNYFQLNGNLPALNERYVINEVPLMAANFDSDYWVLFDTLRFRVPMYSYLGWFNDQTMNTPISIGTYTYSMIQLIDLHPPLNIVGYQIPKYFCWECPYAPTIVGVYSKYNYDPTCNILLDDEMIGDTINLFVETVFNTDLGESETINDNLTVIIK